MNYTFGQFLLSHNQVVYSNGAKMIEFNCQVITNQLQLQIYYCWCLDMVYIQDRQKPQ